MENPKNVHERWAKERREGWAKEEQETTATAVVEKSVEASYVLSGAGHASVERVDSDWRRPPDEQRVALYFGQVSVYVTRADLPALIAQLLAVQANGPVSA